MSEIDHKNLQRIAVISHMHLPALAKARKKKVVMKDWHIRYNYLIYHFFTLRKVVFIDDYLVMKYNPKFYSFLTDDATIMVRSKRSRGTYLLFDNVSYNTE